METRGGSRWTCTVLLGLGIALGPSVQAKEPEQPKVPFENQPCQSLSPDEQAKIKMNPPVHSTPSRAPATLKSDNVCDYVHGGTRQAQVGYMTKADYDLNSSDNRSSEKQGPADLPGGFYDKQGGLWFAKNGYYVVVAGKRELREPVARLIAAKL